MINDCDHREPALVCVSFGEKDDVTLDMCVVKEEYDVGNEHVARWNEVTPQNGEIVKTENGIRIVSGQRSEHDKQVCVYYGDWTISGRWETIEQLSPRLFVYHCRNSLFRFDVTFNMERYPWDGNYESLLHE